jgi:hypothetical protein
MVITWAAALGEKKQQQIINNITGITAVPLAEYEM